jgi:RHS repeat-associated protein
MIPAERAFVVRTSKIAGSSTTYTYDRADRLTAAGAVSVTTNAAGVMTSRGADTFAYDQANRLTSAIVSGVAETFAYDGDGIRVSRQTGPGPVVHHVTDINRALPVVIWDGTRKYVWGLDLVYNVAGSTVEVYHHDRLGSIRLLTDSTGLVSASSRFDEWGIPTATTGSTDQPFRFTGEQLDASGLTYLRSRSYDPTLGRFTSRDTVFGSSRNPQTLDRYSYALGNPTTLHDPTGRDTIAVCVTGGLGWGPVGIDIDLCVAVSTSGQGGVTGTVSGAGGANLDAYAGVGVQWSNATNLSELGGPFGSAGGSGVVGVGVQGNVFGGAGECGRIVNGGSAAVVVGGGASAYAGGQGTGVIQVVGPPDQPCGSRVKQ